MKYLVDSHTHTLASGHAYNTITEMARAAADAGLKGLGITDHGPATPAACPAFYFANYKIIDRELFGVRLFMGMEINILDYDGLTDYHERYMKGADVVIASIHPRTAGEGYKPYIPGSEEENTRAYLKAMENPAVNIIGHPDDAGTPVNYETLILAAKDNRVLPEFNASSLDPRNYREKSGLAAHNMRLMARLCMKHDVPIIINTDAHFHTAVGKVDGVLSLLEEEHFPEELVVNRSLEIYEKALKR